MRYIFLEKLINIFKHVQYTLFYFQLIVGLHWTVFNWYMSV